MANLSPSSLNKTSHAVPRRRVLAAGAAFLLAGCGEIPVWSAASSTIKFAAVGLPDAPLQRSTIAKLPYASISAKIGRGARGLLVLGRYDGPDLHWISADRVVLVSRAGRLVKTFGLPENLKDTRATGSDPVATGLHRLDGPVQFERSIDIDRDRRYGIPIRSTFQAVRRERITILDIQFDTVLVRERCVARTIDWDFENAYWADVGTGFVWKSRQHIVRSFEPVEIEVLKPAA